MTRLATSFVVMASTSLLLLLTLSQVLKSQVLYCGRVVSLFLSVLTGSQRLASLLASRHLFDAISVRSVILVRAWSCDGDFSLFIIINHVGDHSTKENTKSFTNKYTIESTHAQTVVTRPSFSVEGLGSRLSSH